MKNYKHYLLPLGAIFIFVLLYNSFRKEDTNYTDNLSIPTLQEEEDSLMEGNKNRSWTEQEAQEYAANFELVRSSIKEAKSAIAKGSSALTDVSLLGNWKCRGPYNMPGAFAFCEVDEGTDTVYTVTYGHYGGVQFIWKGLLAGDNWKLINLKNPSRFRDLIVLPNGNNRRVIATHENGKIMYTDNGGKTWIYSTGLPSIIRSTIVNRQDNNVLYCTDGKNVYKSIDKGTTFAQFQSMVNSSNSVCLYTPRWNTQPNASDVYLALGVKFYKLNASKTSFDPVGTFPSGNLTDLGGDSRKLWIVLGGRKWHYSTDGGVTWKYQLTTNATYAVAENDMIAGRYLGVNPEDPNILIGGYTTPLSTRDGGITTNIDAGKYWGSYQGTGGSDSKLRLNYHPDVRASQFFYDKAGKLYSLRSTDGGVFKSYNEWTKTSFPNVASIQNGIYYNISLYNKPSQETYRGGFMYGYLNSSHLSVGTQDQGWQNTRNVAATNNMYSVDAWGGDGPSCITGDGKIGWRYNYQGTGEFVRIQLYNGTTYRGLSGTSSTSTNFSFTGSSYFTPSVGDWSNGDRIWVLSQTLRRIEYNTATGQTTALEKNLNGTSSYIQGIAQSRVNPSLIYAMQGGTVFKSTDKGTNWTQIANQAATGMSASSQNRGMGWSSPIDQNVILFASQSGTAVKTVFSKNGGTTWTNVTGSGANLFPSAEVNGMAGTADGKLVFASTNMGPYVFIVNDEKWYPLAIADDVPIFWGQIVYCVKYGNQEIVHFSTWGQGFWDFELNAISTALDKQTKENNTFTIYPNPANDIIHINFSEKLLPNATLSIYDNLGRAVINQKMAIDNESIDVSNFTPGVYFITLFNGKEHIRKKFIKV